MPLFGKKEKSLPKTSAPETPPPLSEADLADASRLMDQWDSSIGNSDAVWNCIEAIARRGGFRGSEAMMKEVMDGKKSADVIQRPWRWWNEAARLAQATGNEVLAGRIFLFTRMFAISTSQKMRTVDKMETGLDRPPEDIYKSIASIAISSLARLSPDLIIQDTEIETVDVASALWAAEQVTGNTGASG